MFYCVCSPKCSLFANHELLACGGWVGWGGGSQSGKDRMAGFGSGRGVFLINIKHLFKAFWDLIITLGTCTYLLKPRGAMHMRLPV